MRWYETVSRDEDQQPTARNCDAISIEYSAAMTRSAGTLSRFAFVAAALAAFASAASAHFIFILPAAPAAQGGAVTDATIIFGETLERDGDVDVKLVLGAEFKARTKDGSDAALTIDQTDTGLHLALPANTVAIHGVKDLGLNSRGGKSNWLIYYPKTVVGDPFAATNRIGASPVELVPTGVAGATKLLFLVDGKPMADVDVTVLLPDGTSQVVKTDSAGKTPAFDQAGRYGGWARRWLDTPGEKDGQHYEQVRQYATLVFDVPGTPPAKKPTTAPVEAAKPQAAVAPHPVPANPHEPVATASHTVKATPFPLALPEAASSFGAVVSDGWLYVYGGHIAPTHEYSTKAVSGRLSRLDLSDPKAWQDLPAGPAAQGLNLATYGGKIYRVGGMQPQNAPGAAVDNHSLADVAYFDPSSRSWNALPALPEPRSSHDVAVIGRTLYVVGGWTLDGSMTKAQGWPRTTLALDLENVSAGWTSTPQPFARRALIAAVHDGKLYAIGGFDADNRPSRRVDIFDPATQTWSRGPGLPGDAMNGFAPAACVQDNALYVSVGDGTLYRLDDEDNTWEAVATGTPRIVHRLAPFGSKILIIGGASEGGNLDLIESVSIPSPAADVTAVPTPRGGSGTPTATPTTKPASETKLASTPSPADAQKFCPIMHNEPVDADSIVVTYRGQPVRLCCKDCLKKWNANPDKYANVDYLPQLAGVATTK